MFYRPLSFCFACLMAICLPVLAEQDVDSDKKVSVPRVLMIADADGSNPQQLTSRVAVSSLHYHKHKGCIPSLLQ